jgi:hypothetical protein
MLRAQFAHCCDVLIGACWLGMPRGPDQHREQHRRVGQLVRRLYLTRTLSLRSSVPRNCFAMQYLRVENPAACMHAAWLSSSKLSFL